MVVVAATALGPAVVVVVAGIGVEALVEVVGLEGW